MALLVLKDKDGNVITEVPTIKGDKGDKGDSYILTDDDKSEIAAQVSGDCVSYLEAQNLTDEQKEIARNNINAVDASLVTHDYENEQHFDEQITTLGVVRDFVEDYTIQYSVSAYHNQSLPDDFKQTARENIGAVSQAELGSAVIDGIVVKDTTNSVDYIAKLRLVDGKPVIEYVEI